MQVQMTYWPITLRKDLTFGILVRSSPARLKKFKECIKEEKEESKSLVVLDIETRWNSTYLILESAIKFKNSFASLCMKDSALVKLLRKFGGAPIEEDWKKVSTYVTCNYTHEIFETRLLLANNMSVDNEAVLLDPRHKWNYVDWIVGASYDATKGTLLSLKIKMVFQNLFDSYTCSMPPPKTSRATSSTSTSSTSSIFTQSETQGIGKVDLIELMNSRYQMEIGCSLTNVNKSELDRYLEDACEPRDSNFDILLWLKDQTKRYPILKKMSKDVLAIPISTVASEYAFSTGGRILDDFRTSLTPKMAEALICAQDWLRISRTSLAIEESLLALEEMEEGNALTLEHPEVIIDETINVVEDD
ncbi:zinc finger BED domain-containing protein RICESLEEPER 2-like [Amaranthus tricolor]|uniref:zinc finger BED domain-containing protein RICESLEEPER 2-like n=1 Tax=Amaranthus tricolor TaxID=29722 RepID=UPI002585D36B|nr:zinc finger BED domain-containing protein RICESLEEPER 2-like [Amaranthus tricolor]